MKLQQQRGLRVLIPQHIRSYNRGDAAITHGICTALRRAGLCVDEITIVATEVDEDMCWYENIARVIPWGMNNTFSKICRLIGMHALGATYKISPVIACRIFKGEFWRAFLEADLILVASGNCLVNPSVNIQWYLAVAKFAQIARKTVVIPGASILGCQKKWLSQLLNNVQVVTLRDSVSHRYCHSVVPAKANVYLTADMAYLLNPAPQKEAMRILSENGVPENRPLIGVTVARDSYVGKRVFSKSVKGPTLTEPEQAKRHAQLVAEALDTVVEELNAAIVFLPHSTGSFSRPLTDDREMQKSVASLMRHSDNAFSIEDEYSCKQLKALLGLMDMVVGERVHSVINAAAMRVPGLCISSPEDPRTSIVTELLGITGNLYDIGNLQAESLAKKILETWERREEIRSILDVKIPEMESQALRAGKLIAAAVDEMFVENKDDNPNQGPDSSNKCEQQGKHVAAGEVVWLEKEIR